MVSKKSKKQADQEQPKEDLFENWPSLSSRVAEDVFALLDGYERRTVPNRIPVQIRFEESDLVTLDDVAKTLGKSRNEMVSILVRGAIHDAVQTIIHYGGTNHPWAGEGKRISMEEADELKRADRRSRYTREGGKC